MVVIKRSAKKPLHPTTETRLRLRSGQIIFLSSLNIILQTAFRFAKTSSTTEVTIFLQKLFSPRSCWQATGLGLHRRMTHHFWLEEWNKHGLYQHWKFYHFKFFKHTVPNYRATLFSLARECISTNAGASLVCTLATWGKPVIRLYWGRRNCCLYVNHGKY